MKKGLKIDHIGKASSTMPGTEAAVTVAVVPEDGIGGREWG